MDKKYKTLQLKKIDITTINEKTLKNQKNIKEFSIFNTKQLSNQTINENYEINTLDKLNNKITSI
jgi:hypothetical protein